ncbi:IclR family transcriptional regulator [Variovorax guangxiensis]|uniref:IclR family transcriptional regulator n=1 Tax=Variovorax guangxiensis TaxID=1775474 RepID=UPI00285422B0|nr:IclR family transcriptional regulator [Variovorax guangxiensis]MDR6858638.1 DNA-binding IclR family transcriptional regulator [Variovorax guangxiensis]
MMDSGAGDIPELNADRARKSNHSIEAGGRLLLVLAAHGRPMRLRELAGATGMAPGQAHPYLVSFGKLGFVSKEPDTGHYWLGPTAIELGLVSLRALNPVREATPFAEALARETGHSVALSVWGNQGPTIVALFDAAYPLHTNMRVGTVMSVAGTATGRLFAAHLPAQLVKQTLLHEAGRLGPDIAPPVSFRELATLLQEIHFHGVARALDAPTPGVRAFAAPAFDYSGSAVLALTLIGRSQAFDSGWDGTQARAVKHSTTQISRRLGALSSASTLRVFEI